VPTPMNPPTSKEDPGAISVASSISDIAGLIYKANST
jgi:hypothetical protein